MRMMSTVVKDGGSKDDEDKSECDTDNNAEDVGTGPLII